MSTGLEVRLLGPTAVRWSDRPVEVNGAPQRTILARLALDAGRPVADTVLVDALWPQGPPPNAHGNLQSYVSRLRAQVGADTVPREPAGYLLAVTASAVDAHRFEQAVAAAGAAEAPARRRERSAVALELWGGDPFSDVVEPVVFEPQLVRLRRLRALALECWLAARVDCGDVAGTLPDLERAAAEDPAHEALQVLLARVLHLAGRTPEALRTLSEHRARLVDESGLDPGPAVPEMEQQILTDADALRPAAAVRTRRRSRCAPPDRFFGREEELARLTAALREHRIVTVVGPGGCGKTRLAQEVVDRLDRPATTFVELGPLAPGEAIDETLARALGLRAAPDGVETAVRDALGSGPSTLVLDNCEHVVASARSWTERLVAADADVSVLATSRVPLGTPGEVVQRLGSLDPSEQVALFCDRAARFRPGFGDAPADLARVGSICQQLGGLPLALELAARREAVFGLDELDTQLAEGLEVIEPTGAGGHGVLHTVDWSYRLLDEPARELFDRLAVCAGGFGLDAATAMAPATAGAVGSLAALVEASLVEADLAARPTRYRMPEVMRRVGLSHLADGRLDDARRQHRRWIRRHLERCHRLQCDRSPDATLLLRAESANISMALDVQDGSTRDEVAEMAVHAALLVFDDPNLEVLGRLRRLEPHAAGDDEPAALHAMAVGTAAWVGGATELASTLLAHSLAVLPRSHPLRWVAHFGCGANAMFVGDLPLVERSAVELLDDDAAPAWAKATGVCCAALMQRFCGDDAAAAAWVGAHAALLDDVAQVDGFVPYTRGELAAAENPVGALGWFDESLALSRRTGHTYDEQLAGIGRASVLVRMGSDDAPDACANAVAGAARIGMWPQAWTAMRLSAELLAGRGDPATAVALLTAAAQDPLASEVLELDLGRQERLWASIQAALSPAELGEAQGLGSRLSRSEAVELTLEALSLR